MKAAAGETWEENPDDSGCGVWSTWAEEAERSLASWKLGYRGRKEGDQALDAVSRERDHWLCTLL